MEKQIFENYSEKEKVEMLNANADAIEEMHYVDYLDASELVIKKDELATASIAMSKLDDEKKEFNEAHKLETAPLKVEISTLLNDIKHGSVNVYGKCFKMIEGDRVGFYNQKGSLVYERVARVDERQGTIMQLTRKTGTDE